MSILFKKVKQKINDNGEIKDKFIAKIHIQRTVDIEELCQKISDSTPFTQGEVLGIIWELEHQVSLALSDSNSVKLGYLGTFYPCISSSSSESFEQCDAKTIKRKYCRFKPSKSFTEKIKNTDIKAFGSDSFFIGKRKDTAKTKTQNGE